MKKKPLEYALYLLELRDRTEGEIREKMRVKKYESVEIDKTIKFLKDRDFIDDERFVKRFIESKQQFGTTGKYKIRQKLIQLHISSELIDRNVAAIEPEGELSRARELAENWLARKGRDEKTYEKLGRFLTTRGFEWEVVKEVLGEVLKN